MTSTEATPNQAFMTLLKRHRLAAGLDQGQLAKKLGITNSAVSLWETSGVLPKPKLFPKLARILGIDPMELTRVIDPNNTDSSKEASK